MCVKLEKVGIPSRRTQTVEFYKHWNPANRQIRALDIKLGNLCNLKCTICDPSSSTAWIPDALRMGMIVADHSQYNKHYNQDLQLSIQDPALLKDLEMIKFWGGEPLLNEKHADILEFLDQVGVLKNCRVIYNTNGTHRVPQRVLDLWSRAQLVEIYFSIDDIEHRFDYQRYGADWSAVQDNLSWYREHLAPNHLFYIMCTVSYLNILYLPQLFDWKKQSFDHNRMQDPINICLQPASGNCSAQFVPFKLKQCLQNNFKNYPQLTEFLNYCQVADDSCAQNFINYVDRLDEIRGTDWRNTFKELATVI